MSLIRFRYQDAKGNVSLRELQHWSENSLYIQGRAADESFPKTFRKDRIIEFLFGEEFLLKDLAPPAPVHKLKPSYLAAKAAHSSNDSSRQLSQGANTILFTGFYAAQRAELEEVARQSGMTVMKSSGKSLSFLCYGFNAGPSKVAKAQEAGSFIIDSDQFLHLIRTGELP